MRPQGSPSQKTPPDFSSAESPGTPLKGTKLWVPFIMPVVGTVSQTSKAQRFRRSRHTPYATRFAQLVRRTMLRFARVTKNPPINDFGGFLKN